MKALTFKHEDEVDGIPIGPVFLWDLEDENVRDTPIGPTTVGFGVAYGEPVPGLTELGWMSMPDALKIAEKLGLELGES